MSKTILFLPVLFFTCSLCYAQEEVADTLIHKIDVFQWLTSGQNDAEGDVQIRQEEKIRYLVLNHILSNKKQEGIPGYRIRIFSEKGAGARQQANEAIKTFEEKYPDIPAYLDYDVPFFKVYVGNFRTRTEALIHLNEVKKDYPDAFYLKEWIAYPKLK